jgi:hypothetical protein
MFMGQHVMDEAFPITRDIICLHCGHNGVMDIHDENDVAAKDRLFLHLGHNHSSGDIHYQCPACRLILLVDPMLALEKKVIRGMPQPRTGSKTVKRERALQGLISGLLAKLFLNENDERRLS